MAKIFVSSFLSVLAASSLLAQATPAKPPVQEKPKAAVAVAKPEQKKVAPAAAAAAAAPKPATAAAPRRADGTTATVDQIKDAQKALTAKGLYKGAVSGRLNKDLKAALTEYQKQNNLKPTGRLNQETIAKLKQG